MHVRPALEDLQDQSTISLLSAENLIALDDL